MSGNYKEQILEFTNQIKNKSIANFTEYALGNVPDYFWTLPASTMRRHHGPGELLVEHVISCAKIAVIVANEQFKNHWNQTEKDQLLSAILLHDGWRCGYPGKECRISKEDAMERGGSEDIIGNLKTSRHHPEIGYKMLFSLACSYNNDKTVRIKIHREEYNPILAAVRYHYGPWTSEKFEKVPILFDRYDSIIVQTHNIDFHQATNMFLYREEHS